MGEVAGAILWGRALGKEAFRQGHPGNQQGETPAPGGPGLGLRQAQLRAQSPHGGAVGLICPRVKIRGHQGARQLVSQESPQLNPVHGAHRPASVCLRPESRGGRFLPSLCGWWGRPAPRLLPGRVSWPGVVCVQDSGDKGSGLRRDTGGSLRAGPGCSPSWGSQVRSAGRVGWPQPEAPGRGCVYPARGAGCLGCSPP